MNDRPEETLMAKTLGKAREVHERTEEWPDALPIVGEAHILLISVPAEDEPFIESRYRELFEANEELQYHYFCVEPDRDARLEAQRAFISDLEAYIEEVRSWYAEAGIDISATRSEREQLEAVHG